MRPIKPAQLVFSAQCNIVVLIYLLTYLITVDFRSNAHDYYYYYPYKYNDDIANDYTDAR